MSGERQRGALTGHVLAERLWGQSSFFLLDVGCSGGLDARWQAFGRRLRAVGFDPLLAEIERLNADNTCPSIRYEAAFVTCRNYDELLPLVLRTDRVRGQNDDPFGRTSAVAAARQLQVSYAQSVFNRGAPIVLADRSIVLDEWVTAEEHAGVDFIKIDTDGHDIEVILGAEAIMSAGGVLGVLVEVQLHGVNHEFANTFSNIDRILRRRGFTLFDLPVYRYSRAQLPAPFVWDMAAQTTSGQVLWGDALYCRDLGSTDYERMWPGYAVTPERVMKLACLFDLFDLPDCAAELLLNRGQFLEARHRETLLDALVTGEPGSYAALVAKFEADFTAFYPSRLRRPAEAPRAEAAPPAVESSQPPETIQRLHQRVATLKEKNAALRERMKRQEATLAKLKARLSALEAKRP